jgi:hypothetical protein
MKLRTTLLAAVASIGLATAASAAPLTNSSINLNGFVIGGGGTTLVNSTSLDFTTALGVPNAGPGVISSYGTGTGTFASFSCSTGSCGSIQDIASLSIGAQNITNFLSLSGGNNASPINFSLSDITAIGRTSPFLTFVATGTITYDGFDPTPGSFQFSAQGNQITTFSATTLSTAVPTPEPASLALLGGSLAALGLIRRRKS